MGREFTYRFCPECGQRLIPEINEGPGPSPLVCTRCDLKIHLDPKVAVASMVVREGAVLLLKRARPPRKGYWCLPGGFVDRGETLEQAAIREVREETGLAVRIEGLFGLYSYEGYPIVVAIFRTADVTGDLAVGPAESVEAGWFDPGSIPWDALAFPSTTDALKVWVQSDPR